jgi:hypothetical protein
VANLVCSRRLHRDVWMAVLLSLARVGSDQSNVRLANGMRASATIGILVYCADYRCSHAIEMSAESGEHVRSAPASRHPAYLRPCRLRASFGHSGKARDNYINKKSRKCKCSRTKTGRRWTPSINFGSRAPKRAEHVSPFPQTSGKTSRSFAPVRSATARRSASC